MDFRSMDEEFRRKIGNPNCKDIVGKDQEQDTSERVPSDYVFAGWQEGRTKGVYDGFIAFPDEKIDFPDDLKLKDENTIWIFLEKDQMEFIAGLTTEAREVLRDILKRFLLIGIQPKWE